MKPILQLALLVFTLQSIAQSPPETRPSSDAQAASTVPASSVNAAEALSVAATNLLGKLGHLSASIQIESLTLNLNGYALVGLQNSLNNLTAEQFIDRATNSADPTRATFSLKATTPVHPDEPSTQPGAAASTNAMSVVSNLLHLADQLGFGVRIGKMTLNLNGHALVGATNYLADLRTTQRITNLPPTTAFLATGLPDNAGTNSQLLKFGELQVDLNGTAVVTLPPDAQTAAAPRPTSEQP